jgi:hypothetical protein
MSDKIYKIYNELIPLIGFVGFLIYLKTSNPLQQSNRFFGLSPKSQAIIAWAGIGLCLIMIIWKLSM